MKYANGNNTVMEMGSDKITVHRINIIRKGTASEFIFLEKRVNIDEMSFVMTRLNDGISSEKMPAC
jgi:hypothetical protein